MEQTTSGELITTLDAVSIGVTLAVQEVEAPPTTPEWARWLDEIGFIGGEQVTLLAKGAIGGDPLVVRIGQSTFALRRAEAACVRVAPLGEARSGRRTV